MAITCARCYDHGHDPVLQHESCGVKLMEWPLGRGEFVRVEPGTRRVARLKSMTCTLRFCCRAWITRGGQIVIRTVSFLWPLPVFT